MDADVLRPRTGALGTSQGADVSLRQMRHSDGMRDDDHRVLYAAGRSETDDAAAVAFILSGGVTQRWQLAGEALLAVDAGAAGRVEAATVVVDALHQRGDRGDWFLAAHLVTAVGLPGPTILADHADRLPELTPLPVDLDSVADVIDSRGEGGWIDRTTGFAVQGDYGSLAYLDDDGGDGDGEEESERWIRLDSLGSREAFQDMADFTDSVSEPPLRARLERALGGDRPFRRFADAIFGADEDELTRWNGFRSERRVGRARRYLVDDGYLPLPLSP